MSEKEELKQLEVIESIRSRRLDTAEKGYNMALSSLRQATDDENESLDSLNKYEVYKDQRDKEIVQGMLEGTCKINEIFSGREELGVTKDTLSEKIGKKREATDLRISREDDTKMKKIDYRKSFVDLEKIKILRDILSSSSY